MKSIYEEIDKEIKVTIEENNKLLEKIFEKHEWTDKEYVNEMLSRMKSAAKISSTWNVKIVLFIKTILSWIIPHSLYELIMWKLMDILAFIFRTRDK